MPNPSEMNRLEEERAELYSIMLDRKRLIPKSQAEKILGQIRTIEKTLGIKGENYNSNDFGKEFRDSQNK